MSSVISPDDERSKLSWGVTKDNGEKIPTTNVGKYYYGDEDGNVRTSLNDQNWIVYRLADLYLMEAEALAMKGDDLDSAVELVNIIRERGGSPKKSASGLDQRGVLDIIMDERGIEFYAEGKRWFDLLRVGLRDDASLYKDWLLNKCTEDLNSVETALVKSKMNKNIPDSWYLPVNSDELSENPLLIQNPAYAAYGK